MESDNGQTTLPGVHSGQNGFGVATDENGDGTANEYDPPDAIAGAAKYLLEFNVQANPSAAIFAYNHLQSYVQSVLFYAGQALPGTFGVSLDTRTRADWHRLRALRGDCSIALPSTRPPPEPLAGAWLCRSGLRRASRSRTAWLAAAPPGTPPRGCSCARRSPRRSAR